MEPKLTPFDLSVLTLIASGVRGAELEQRLSGQDANQVASYLKAEPKEFSTEVIEVGEALRHQIALEKNFPVMRWETQDPEYDGVG